jgi:hypothetical protein
LFAEVFGAPKKKDWAAPNFHLRLSLPRVVMDMLHIPATSTAVVITTMEAISDAHEAKKGLRPVGDKQIGARCQGPYQGLHAPGRSF